MIADASFAPFAQFASHRRQARCIQSMNERAPRTRSTSVDERPRSGHTRCKRGKQEILNGETEQKRIGNGQSLHCVRVLDRWNDEMKRASMINRRRRRRRDQGSSVSVPG